MKNEGYINIQGWMINSFRLKSNELLLFALIYGFSQDGKSQFRGSLSYIEKALQISKRTVIRTLNDLIDKKLITKTVNNDGNLYSANLTLLSDKGVTKCHTTSDKMSPIASDKSIHNNNIYNNIYNNTSNETSLQVSELIKDFEGININAKNWYGNKTQRKALADLIESIGFERSKKIISILPKTNKLKYVTTVTTPHQLLNKFSDLETQLSKLKEEKSKKIIL